MTAAANKKKKKTTRSITRKHAAASRTYNQNQTETTHCLASIFSTPFALPSSGGDAEPWDGGAPPPPSPRSLLAAAVAASGLVPLATAAGAADTLPLLLLAPPPSPFEFEFESPLILRRSSPSLSCLSTRGEPSVAAAGEDDRRVCVRCCCWSPPPEAGAGGGDERRESPLLLLPPAADGDDDVGGGAGADGGASSCDRRPEGACCCRFPITVAGLFAPGLRSRVDTNRPSEDVRKKDGGGGGSGAEARSKAVRWTGEHQKCIFLPAQEKTPPRHKARQDKTARLDHSSANANTVAVKQRRPLSVFCVARRKVADQQDHTKC